MGNIDWLPIEDLPEELKDGRDLLAWCGGRCFQARWIDKYPALAVCVKQVPSVDERMFIASQEITHFAEINPPA